MYEPSQLEIVLKAFKAVGMYVAPSTDENILFVDKVKEAGSFPLGLRCYYCLQFGRMWKTAWWSSKSRVRDRSYHLAPPNEVHGSIHDSKQHERCASD